MAQRCYGCYDLYTPYGLVHGFWVCPRAPVGLVMLRAGTSRAPGEMVWFIWSCRQVSRRIKVHQGSSRFIKVHQGESRFIKANQGWAEGNYQIIKPKIIRLGGGG